MEAPETANWVLPLSAEPALRLPRSPRPDPRGPGWSGLCSTLPLVLSLLPTSTRSHPSPASGAAAPQPHAFAHAAPPRPLRPSLRPPAAGPLLVLKTPSNIPLWDAPGPSAVFQVSGSFSERPQRGPTPLFAQASQGLGQASGSALSKEISAITEYSRMYSVQYGSCQSHVWLLNI